MKGLIMSNCLSKENIEAGEDYFSIMEKNLISLTNGLN